MKKFFVYTFALIIYVIGCAGVSFFTNTKADHWYCWLFAIIAMLIYLPAFWWWHDYFKKLFDIEDDD